MFVIRNHLTHYVVGEGRARWMAGRARGWMQGRVGLWMGYGEHRSWGEGDGKKAKEGGEELSEPITQQH